MPKQAQIFEFLFLWTGQENFILRKVMLLYLFNCLYFIEQSGITPLIIVQFNIIWRYSSLREYTPIIFDMELIHLGYKDYICILIVNWKPPSQSELTQIIFNTELTHLSSEACKYF